MISWLMGAATRVTGISPTSSQAETLFGAKTTVSGQDINPVTALNISAFYCGVLTKADSFASLPCFVYTMDGERNKTTVPSHPVYKLLHDAPNPSLTPSRAKRLISMHLDTWGNAYFEIVRNGRGDAVQIWPIHPSRVKPEQSSTGAVTYKVYNGLGEPVTLDGMSMLHFMNISHDGIIGISPIGLARESMGLTVAAEAYGASFYGNSGASHVVIHNDKKTTGEQNDEIRRKWEEKQTGTNQHRVAVLGNGWKIENFSLPNDDMQFLETRAFQVLEIARWLKVPPHKLQDYSRAHFANIEHSETEYHRDSIQPRAIDAEEELTRKLLRSPMSAEFSMDALLRADTKTRTEVLEIRRRNGVINADEWRRLENQNPIGGEIGEAYIVEANRVTVENLIRPPVKTVVQAAEPPNREQPPVEPDEQEEREERTEPQSRSNIPAAERILWRDVLDRSRRLASNAARRASKSKTYDEWMATFGLNHAKSVAEWASVVLEASSKIMGTTRTGDDGGSRFANRWLEEMAGPLAASWGESCEVGEAVVDGFLGKMERGEI